MKYANPIFMPQLGQTVEDSTLVRWLKEEGDNVKIGDILFELEKTKLVQLETAKTNDSGATHHD